MGAIANVCASLLDETTQLIPSRSSEGHIDFPSSLSACKMCGIFACHKYAYGIESNALQDADFVQDIQMCNNSSLLLCAWQRRMVHTCSIGKACLADTTQCSSSWPGLEYAPFNINSQQCAHHIKVAIF